LRVSIIIGAAAAAAGAFLYALQVDRPELAATGPRVNAQLERVFDMGDSPGRQPRFSQDSKLLALTNAAGAVYLLRTSDWKLLRKFDHPNGATAAAFSSDGRSLFTAGYDGAIRSWDVGTGKPGATMKGSAATVWTLDVSADGRKLVAAGEDSMARVWALDHPDRPPLELRGHQRNIWEARFSPVAPQLATGSFDYKARVWDLATGKTESEFAGHTQAIVGLDYRHDGKLIASSSDDSTIRLWRPGDGKQVRLIPTGNHTYAVHFSPDGKWLASGGRSRSALGTMIYGLTGLGSGTPPVQIWRVADGALVAALPNRDDVVQMDYAPDGRHIVTADDGGEVHVWRVGPASYARNSGSRTILPSSRSAMVGLNGISARLPSGFSISSRSLAP
jgi:WD40 repeat protein